MDDMTDNQKEFFQSLKELCESHGVYFIHQNIGFYDDKKQMNRNNYERWNITCYQENRSQYEDAEKDRVIFRAEKVTTVKDAVII